MPSLKTWDGTQWVEIQSVADLTTTEADARYADKTTTESNIASLNDEVALKVDQAEADTLYANKADTTAAIERAIPDAEGTERQTIRISGGEPRWRDSPNFFGRDYMSGDPAENASPGFAQAIADIQEGQGPVGVHGGNLQLEEGEYRLTETLDLTRFTGRIGGNGTGISPYHSSTPGRATVILWDGPAGAPVFRVRDSYDVTFEDLRIECMNGSPASFGIEWNAQGGEGAGTNGRLFMRRLHIGEYSWSRQGLNGGTITSGVGFTGHNSNNDQFELDWVTVDNPIEYGLYMPNPQSVGSSIQNFNVSSPGIAGIATGASVYIENPGLFSCPLAIEMLNSNAVVTVNGGRCENSDTFAKTTPNGILSVKGLYIQVGDTITGSGVFINAFPMGNFVLNLEDLFIAENTDPSNARIEIGPADPHIGRFQVNVNNVMNMRPDQLVFASGASLWASGVSPSMGTVDWKSFYNNRLYHFRNELRNGGAGTRTTINTDVWDQPFSGDDPITMNMRRTMTTKTSDYVATIDDHLINVDASSASVRISLPSLTGGIDHTGKEITIKKLDAVNDVVIDPFSTQTIDGAETKTLASQYATITVVCDGSQWLIMNQLGTIT